MKNKRVIFGGSLEYHDPNTGLKEWDRPTIEFDIEDGDDFLENLRFAKLIIKEFFRENIAHQRATIHGQCEPQNKWNSIYDNRVGISDNLPLGNLQESNIDRTQAFIDLINSKYQTKKTLLNLKPKVDERGSEELSKAFEDRIKQFD
jgi:hypothetical protein